MEVNNPSKRPFNQVDELGVVISEAQSGQKHVGVLYKTKDDVAMICHLAWHKDIRNEVPTNDFFWLQSALDDVNKRVVKNAVEGIIARNKPPIPYSPIFKNNFFKKGSLEYIPGKAGEGLTCATFIIAIFEALGLEILEIYTWKLRDSDRAWQEHIVNLLENWGNKRGVDVSDHVAAIRASTTSIRVRPEEVAAGVASPDIPLTYEEASELGRDIVNLLK